MAGASPTPRHEFVAAVLLGLAAVGSAWNASQAARWGGEQAEATITANTLRAAATEAAADADAELQVDLATFLEWADATSDGREDLAAFLEERFPAELWTAFQAWRSEAPVLDERVGRPVPPGTPFDRPEYRPEGRGRVAALHAEAAAAVARAHVTNAASTNSVAAIVPFAVVLCLAGVATKLDAPWPRLVLLGLAALMLVGGTVATVLVPIVAGV